MISCWKCGTFGKMNWNCKNCISIYNKDKYLTNHIFAERKQILAKIRYERNKEEIKTQNRERGKLQKNKIKQKLNKKKQYQQKKEQLYIERQKPENKARQARNDKARYEKNKNNSEFKTKQALKNKEYRNIPKNIEKEKIRKSKPEYKITTEAYRNKSENKARQAKNDKIRYEKNKNNPVFLENRRITHKIYYSKPEIKERENFNKRQKYNKNPWYKLRSIISKSVRVALKQNKKNNSILNYLPDSIEIIKQKLEEKFEDWMTWENHGKYDPNRRTWQIDHIIPQSALPYTSMEDENFKICWSVDNLQPLEAIKNIKKGNKLGIK